MRLGELLNVRWADIDEMDKYIHILKTKNDKPRMVPLTMRARNSQGLAAGRAR
jgi:integrase